MSKNGKKNSAKPIDLHQLPIFQIVGRTEQDRRACAELLMLGLEQNDFRTSLFTSHSSVTLLNLFASARHHDLVLTTAESSIPMQQIVFDGEASESSELPPIVYRQGNVQHCLRELTKRLQELVDEVSVWGCILIGGKSSRMGQPKHLIRGENGKTWLENSIKVLRSHVDGVVVVGGGYLPESLVDIVRLPDIPGVVGPLTGIASACRWQPLVSWLLIACDMPLVSKESVAWLLDNRCAGNWGTVPILDNTGRYEPLFAHYDYRAGSLFEKQVLKGNLRIGEIGSNDKITNPLVPETLRHCWGNVNTPEQLKKSIKERS